MTRSPQDLAALKANLLEAAVTAAALALAVAATVVTARMTAGTNQLAAAVAAGAGSYYATRAVLRLIIRDTQTRLHITAGCTDCTTNR